MRKTFLLLFLTALFATALQAQVGFEGGVNFANLAIKSYGDKVGTKFLIGATLGLFGDFKLGDGGHMYFEPGAYFQNNGAKIKGNPEGKYIINGANFPLYIEYKSGDKCSKRFFCGIGPYVDVNINGADDYGTVNSTSLTNTEIVIGTDLRRADLGLAANIGYIGRKHLFIRAHYQMGLINEIPDGNSQNSLKQSCGSLTIGWMIRGCRANGWGGSYRRREGNHWRGLKKNRWSTKQSWRRPPGPGY